MTEKETIKEMEYILGLLHKEWEYSKRTEKTVFLKLADKEKRRTQFAAMIQKKQKQRDLEELNFRKSIELSKENFILFRLIKKITMMEDKETEKENPRKEICIELDKEEYLLFCDIKIEQEG